MGADKPDFSGYATKAGLVCSDGRTIMPDAFKHQHNETVPLVWMHDHNDPKNILGKAVLEHRSDGVVAHAYFNDSEQAQHVKKLVQHGDVVSLSIFANQLREQAKQVMHGMIRELSVVLTGANEGAKIIPTTIRHSDGSYDTLEDEAVITTGIPPELEHADSGKTLQQIVESMNDEQQGALEYLVGAALETAGVKHSDEDGETIDDESEDDESDDTDDTEDAESDESDEAKKKAKKQSEDDTSDDETSSEDAESDDTTSKDNGSTDDATNGDLAHKEGTDSMSRNVFDQIGGGSAAGATLTHTQFAQVMKEARDQKLFGGSFRETVLSHADEYGITNIELLFPDAKALENSPQLKARRMEWVAKVLDGTKHTPFAKVKSVVADLTADEARARGYVKGTKKVDEVIELLRRSTGPATIYKKQRLDRDDVLDITDMDVVAFLKAEMRLMLEEEIARAILVGDGRPANDPAKVKDPAGSIDGVGIRSIMRDSDLYTITEELGANTAPKDAVKGIVRARSKYRGTGKPTLFISDAFLTDIMLEEDKFGRSLYETEASLADKLRVESIVTVDLFDEYEDLFAILVNLSDYSIGTNKGGELTSFEDFDIDFNQHQYLQETRLSGGLTKPYSAIVIKRAEGESVTPTVPTFNNATNTITVPSKTGVVYSINGDPVEAGDVVIEQDTTLDAAPDEGYYFPNNVTRSWNYTYTAQQGG